MKLHQLIIHQTVITFEYNQQLQILVSLLYALPQLVLNVIILKHSANQPQGLLKSKIAAKRTRQHARINQRLSSTKGCLPPKVIFHQRLSSTKGCFPPKVVFHQRLFSTEDCLTTEGCLHMKVFFHHRLSSTYHNTLVDLIFVRTVNIANFSLLPCLEVT